MSYPDLKEALFQYFLRLGDSSLILGQRLSEWSSKAPTLEEDIALTNISLDLIGQSRMLLTFAGETEGKGRDEDKLAYFRDSMEYRNFMLVEQPNGNFAMSCARQYLYDCYSFHIYTALCDCKNEQLAAFARKSLKEVTYHRRHSGEWVLRLGDGTEESNQKIQHAFSSLWMFTKELFDADHVDIMLFEKGIAPDLNIIRKLWDNDIKSTLKKAKINIPDNDVYFASGSREGKHSEHLGYILAEMQFLQRTYPGAQW